MASDVNLFFEKMPQYRTLVEDPPGILEIVPVEKKAGFPVPQVHQGERKVLVHSARDPQREAGRFADSVEEQDLYIIMGGGFFYHVEEVLAGAGKDATVVVIEKYPDMVAAALKARDLRKLFSDERFILLIDPQEEELAKNLKGKSSMRSLLLHHRGSVSLDEGYYENTASMVKSYLSTKEVNIATLAKFERLWGNNIARNIRTFIETPGADIFYDRFKGYSAIVIGAGPSLASMVPWIRNMGDRAVLIAVDTVLQYLLENGIVPHFCLSVDPQIINARYVEGMEEVKTILVGEPLVHPAVYRFFAGRQVTTGIAFELLKWIERVSGSKGEITHGGSVSTNSADFARRLGVDTIYLIGQDLAFTQGRAHMKGGYFEELHHSITHRTKTAEMINRGQLFALPRILVPGIDGTPVHTNQKMMVFLNWFSRQSLPLVNITPMGAQIPSVTHLDYKSVVLDDLSVWQKVDEIWDSAASREKNRSDERLLERIDVMSKELSRLVPKLKEGITLSEKLHHEVSDGINQGAVNYLVKKLAQVDEAIEKSYSIKDMISFSSQRVIHTITEGYETGEGEDSTAQRSLYLYRGLLEGALFNERVLHKMKNFLQDGKKK